VHRHEPPVANDPVKILHMDKEREFMVISKPGSVVRLGCPMPPWVSLNPSPCTLPDDT
jgi:hypothetical protein